MLVKVLSKFSILGLTLSPGEIGSTTVEEITNKNDNIECVFNENCKVYISVSNLSITGPETVEDVDFLLNEINHLRSSQGILSIRTEMLGIAGLYLTTEDVRAGFNNAEFLETKKRQLLNDIIIDIAFEEDIPVYISLSMKGDNGDENEPILAKYNGKSKSADIVMCGGSADDVIERFFEECIY